MNAPPPTDLPPSDDGADRASLDWKADLGASLRHGRVHRIEGRLVQAVGPLLEAELPGVPVGSTCRVEPGLLCEVVGFKGPRALLVPLENTEGASFGSRVTWLDETLSVTVGDGLLGRVLDGLGKPMDGGPPLPAHRRRRVAAQAEGPLRRSLITQPLPTGVRAVDSLLTLGRGQRIGIVAGSGIGKSTLLGMMARGVDADVSVICLVGERGREVREFLEHNLGSKGLQRAVVVAATSEQSPAVQIKATLVATTIAEHFRDQGKDVLLLMDSLTRLALAQRQIGLAAGEPPTTRGYTPSVFAFLPRLLERAGPGVGGGSITGVYTVLVEGDDVHDPVGDAVRGIADGHIVLSRKLASHGHYPAIDILGSLSRLMERVSDTAHQKAAARVRDLLATWHENEDMIRLGMYRKGSAAHVDEAIDRLPQIEALLKQSSQSTADFDKTVKHLVQKFSS